MISDHRRPPSPPGIATALVAATLLVIAGIPANGEETSWQDALAGMPLSTPVKELNRKNFAPIMLGSFQSNRTVKALILQPGATDEFYFFNRAKASLAAASPTLLDAVNALTNQTRIRVRFRPPFLLLHADDDPTEPLATIRNRDLAARLKRTPFVPHFLFNDHDWDHVQPILADALQIQFTPPAGSPGSWHFFRHALTGWNLTGWEALEAVSLANKTTFTLRRKGLRRRPSIVFEGDTRNPARDRGK